MAELTLLFSLVSTILVILWMVRMLRFAKESRIIQSMTLKVMIEALSQQGVTIDIQKIQREVEQQL
jgi:hypothetical protein